MTARVYDLCEMGATGDGLRDDTPALIAALAAARLYHGAVQIPPGRFLVEPQVLRGLASKIAIRGFGPNVSVLVSRSGGAILDLEFVQEGVTQPFGLCIDSVGFQATGPSGSPLRISFGNPATTSDHFRPSTTIRNVIAASDQNGWFVNGLVIEAAWNLTMSDCSFAGRAPTDFDPSGKLLWNGLAGNGLSMTRMCVNARVSNCQFNFWATGVDYRGGQTEGAFFTNCTMVAVKRGVWWSGDGSRWPFRSSTFSWIGGMIECRVNGVHTGSAAFHFVSVWDAKVIGCELVTEYVPAENEQPITYGLFVDGCHKIVVSGCGINSWRYGLWSNGPCSAIISQANTYTNCQRQNWFNLGAEGCRSGDHGYFNNAPLDFDGSADPKKPGSGKNLLRGWVL